MHETSNVTSSFRNLLLHVTPYVEFFSSMEPPRFPFIYFQIFLTYNGQFPGFGEYVIPQLQTCTALVLSAADCTESSCSSNIGCNF